MSIDTVIHAGLTRPTRPLASLVLMGGGARTAYQVGVLRALARMLAQQDPAPKAFPFKILLGTSAGALNAACLASFAGRGLDAFEELARFWRGLRSSSVYRLDVHPLAQASRWITALSLSRTARLHGAMLDSLPLVDTLRQAVTLAGIEQALHSGALDALAVTASSYTSGVHWTFCHTARDARTKPWARPGRRGVFQPITIEHLMASSAIPFIFPATPLQVDGGREFFGDGSMRQVSPLSAALHLGAHKVLAIGVGQPQRSGFGHAESATVEPTLGSIAGHAMASVFHDTLHGDVEQAQRVNETLGQLPREVAAVLNYRSVDILAIQPSKSLDGLAQVHSHELPRGMRTALGGLGALRGGGAALASYLLFEPGFIEALMALGEHDAIARKAELLSMLGAQPLQAVR